MVQKNNTEKYLQLRKDFPLFVYENFTVNFSSKELILSFVFRAEEKYVFNPTLRFPLHIFRKEVTAKSIEIFAFHIGMVEMISYWKAFCSPKILIKPGRLNSAQEQWWKKLFMHGLGEFFYTNGIEVRGEGLFEFYYPESAPSIEKTKTAHFTEGLIVPVGGGKDSVVTLELLKKSGMPIIPLVVNHRNATREVLEVGGFSETNSVEIERSLDPVLLTLNEQGFLNGHTPFSSLLAFIAVLVAYLTGNRHIVLSNESSANEATIPGTDINHQYSKSFEFEKDFRSYVQSHIIDGINYFSFLRPLNELQIGAIFSEMEKYHKVFKSCNAGSKTDSWCCKCSKCLFTWIILAPYMTGSRLVEIFGKNLFENPKLIPILNQLTGLAETKPFECVGTIDEVKSALWKTIANHSGSELPVLLEQFQNQNSAKPKTLDQDFENLLSAFNSNHFLEPHMEAELRKTISQKMFRR